VSTRSRLVLSALVLAGALTACSDVTAPTAARSASAPAFSGGSSTGGGSLGGGGTLSDTSVVSGSGGGGGGSSATYTSCGTLSTNIQAINIFVYTTRIGLGFTGTATNCGSRNEALEVDVTDQNTDPACVVNVPHFIAQKNTGPGDTIAWQANSTLIYCPNTLHTFDVRLYDTKTGQLLTTTTASAFL